jgi:hypothetical protein
MAQAAPVDPPASALRETPASVAALLDAGGGAVIEAAGALVGAILWQEKAGGCISRALPSTPRTGGKAMPGRSSPRASARRAPAAWRGSISARGSCWSTTGGSSPRAASSR